MKCVSCEMEINPKWTHAIEMNVCPGCGNHIMDEHLKNLFVSLRDTMDKMKQYSDQLNDWMLSNHNYIKTDSALIVNYVPESFLKDFKKSSTKAQDNDRKFIVKMETGDGEEDVVAERIQSEERTNDFFKRAEAVKPRLDGFKTVSEKTQRLKELTQQIKKAGSTSVNDDGEVTIMTPDMMDSANPEDIAEFQSMMEGNEITSSLAGSDDEEIPFIVQQMAVKAGGNRNASADLYKLQEHHAKKAESQKNFSTGAKGSFSRG